jgi:F0F1-type ATP synthase beta subunit
MVKMVMVTKAAPGGFSTEDEIEILINGVNITQIVPLGSGSKISFNDGSSVTVIESIQELEDTINQ